MSKEIFPTKKFPHPQVDENGTTQWHFFEEPLNKKLMELEIQTQESLRRAMNNNLTDEFITSLYFKATKKPPENITIEIKGETRCLAGNTRVHTEKGIKKLEEIKIGERVLSYAISPSRRYFSLKPVINKWIYDDSPVQKITFRDGAKLTATPEHRLYCLKSTRKIHNKGCEGIRSRGKWKEVKDMQIGEKVLMPFDYPDFGLELNHKLARILGFIVGDGSLHYQPNAERHKDYKSIKTGKVTTHRWKQEIGRTQFFNIDKSNLTIFKNDFESYFGKPISRYKDPRSKVIILTSNNVWVFNEIRSYIEVHGKDKCSEVRVPKIIWTSDLGSKIEFLRALFSTDAWISDKRCEIEYASISRDLIYDLRLLLLEFGIRTKIIKTITRSDKHAQGYKLTIKGHDNIVKFSGIGFCSTKKQVRLDHLVEHTKSREKNQLQFYNEIISIEDAGLQTVYDLEVAETHSYFAEGMVSHNSGKSTGGIFLGDLISYWWGLEFTEDNILPNQSELLYRLKDAKFGETFLIDEQLPETYGEGVNREAEQLGMNLNICAKQCNNLIFIYPPQFSSRTAPYGLETIAKDTTNKYVKFFYHDLRRKAFGYGGIWPQGFVYLPKVQENYYQELPQSKWSEFRKKNFNERQYDFDSGLEERYEIKKDKWIIDIRNLDVGVRNKKKENIAQELSQDERFISLRSNIEREAYLQLMINHGKMIELAKTEFATIIGMAKILTEDGKI